MGFNMTNKNKNIHFQLHSRDKKEARAIGIISGAVSPEIEKQMEEREAYFNYASKVIKPCDRKFEEIAKLLIGKYGGCQYTPSNNEVEIFKAMVILNHFPEVIKKEHSIDENSKKKEITKYYEYDTYLKQARKYSADKLGLKMKFYRIPKSKNSNTNDYIRVRIEEKSEYVEVDNDSEEMLSLELLLFSGISKLDIESQNNKFKAYALMMLSLGKLKYER